MSSLHVFVHGTLNANGTLELKEIPSLPPGPVEVMIRALPAKDGAEDNWWEYLQRSRAEMVAQGYQFRTKAEIDAERGRQKAFDQAHQQALDSLRSTKE